MLTTEENERLTRVGPGTPAGEMLRRYWWPVGFSEEVRTKPMPVRLLGEDLVLFRDGQGRLGLLERACAHRRASLEFGRVETEGIRCCYHGWLYDVNGRCLQQPAEPEDSTFKDRVRQPAYRAQEAGGLVFGYLGPAPAPLLPNYDLLVRQDGRRVVGADEEYCNWLQRAENSVDEPHLTSLHASVYPEIALKRGEFKWEPTWYGFRSTIFIPGVYDEPRVIHSIFPSHSRITIARVDRVPYHNLRLRVPTDDTKTTTFWVQLYPGDRPGELETNGLRRGERGVYERVDDGWWGIASEYQDTAAQESQGLIFDRTKEHLASSDRGVILYRQMLGDAIDSVENGDDPPGLVRDAAANESITFDVSSIEYLTAIHAGALRA